MRFGFRRLPLFTVLALVPVLILHGLPDLAWPESIFGALLDGVVWTLIAVFVYVVSAIVHEGIHVAAMLVLARVPISSIRFGFRLSEGVLYVHTSRPMSARSYRGVLMLPAILQGFLPLAYGTIAGTGWLVLYGYVMLVSSVGDFAVYRLIRHLHSNDLVRDHPTGVGCQVLARDTHPPAW